jgi:hypothetical protein
MNPNVNDFQQEIKTIINMSKVDEVKDSILSRNKWKKSAYIFEVLNKLFSMFSLLINGAVVISQSEYVSYGALCSQTLAVAFIGFNHWCAKKYSEQATITNAIYDSLKTGKVPTINIASSEKVNGSESNYNNTLSLRPITPLQSHTPELKHNNVLNDRTSSNNTNTPYNNDLYNNIAHHVVDTEQKM